VPDGFDRFFTASLHRPDNTGRGFAFNGSGNPLTQQWAGQQENNETDENGATMKTKDLLTITTVALGTAAMTVAMFLETPLEAGNPADPPAPTIARPRLVANGIELTLAAAETRDLKVGDQPAFELKAVNTLAEPSDAWICLTLSASGPAGTLSRVPQLPATLWQDPQFLTLEPNESKSITFAVRTNLPPNKMILVSLAQVDPPGPNKAAGKPSPARPGIVAMMFSTATPQATPSLASAPRAMSQWRR
jgi:hypothetical protein